MKRLPLPQADVYYGVIFEPQQSMQHFNRLVESVQWMQGKIKLFGKTILEPRLSAWYGDPQAIYTYSGKRNIPLPWTEHLLELKHFVEAIVGTSFNSVLINFYRDGNDSMGWHCDDEKSLGQHPIIASLSFGEKRIFQLKHKFDPLIPVQKIELMSGSLLVMKGETQQFWKHQIPKIKRKIGGRVNLTFRKIIF